MLRLSIIQSDIFWEDKLQNLEQYGDILHALSGKTDLAILPEMCTTGFSMQAESLAEDNTSNTIQTFQQWSAIYKIAITGSFIATDNAGKYYNRGFFITPEGNQYFYDKRHLFRMGTENQVFSSGDSPLIVNYKGWNIKLIICYDLRFPVWIRNKNNAYDLLICCANWPNARKKVWDILLQARAYENLCYVCGVNRIGTDNAGLTYDGGSLLVDPRGKKIINASKPKITIRTATIYKAPLDKMREKFPAWMDADSFTLCD